MSKWAELIQTKVAETIANHRTAQQLASDLGWATGDWCQPWLEIATLELHNALLRAAAVNYAERFGEDVRVFKRPSPGACGPECKRLYVGPDGQPRIFKLSDLVANGNNSDRKPEDWLPVIEAPSPECGCHLDRMPAGWGFNEDTDIVPDGELGVECDRLGGIGAKDDSTHY